MSGSRRSGTRGTKRVGKQRRRACPPSLAKITAPAIHNVYPRARLFDLLDGARDISRIAWIAAPAGAGKTTLVASYVESRELSCLWYQVDAGDRDTASFFHFLGLAVAQAAPRFRRPLPKLTPEYRGGAGVFARNFFREIARRLRPPFALVFDNMQEIESDSDFHAVLCEGLSELPRGVDAVLISRGAAPPAYARMRVSGWLNELDWRQLRLDAMESRALVRFLGRAPEVTPDETVEQLHRHCEGWIAGLILLLEMPPAMGGEVRGVSTAQPQALFDYFAAEVFVRRAPAVRNFLMRTALLPSFTAPMAARLTEYPGATALLDDLVRQHHFTERRPEAPGRYQFHPLFREFLLAQALAAWGAGEVARHRQRAAMILEEAGQTEEALPLYLAAGDSDAGGRLILARAEELATAGRHATLTGLIEQLPAAALDGSPWLLYWRGVSRLPSAVLDARADLEAAYELFDAQGEPAGLYLAWAAIVESFFAEYRDYLPVERWIPAFEELRTRYPEYPSAEVKARVLNAAVGVFMHRSPDHPLLPDLVDRLEALIRATPDASQRVLLAMHALLYHVWFGHGDRARQIVERIGPFACHSSASPIVRLTYCACAAFVEWHQGSPRKALHHVDKGLAIVDDHGLPVLSVMILNHGVCASLACGDLERAARFVEQIGVLAGGRDDIHAAVYHHYASMTAAHRGDLAAAERHGETGAKLAEGVGVPCGYFCNLFSYVVATFMRGDEARGSALLAEARALGTSTGSPYIEFLCRLTECAFGPGDQDHDDACSALRETLALSRELNGPAAPWLPHRVLARVYATALENGIERQHVEHLIAKFEVAATDAVLHVDAWPWPVKVYTFGRFGIVVGGAPLEFSAKAQRRPLELLKTLVALGGRNVREDRLADVLWPEADGHRAALALTTTLHRLRKLIGQTAVERREGRLTLNPRVCWVDAWSMQRLLTVFERSWRTESPDAIAVLIEGVSVLYRGPFLADHDEQSWLLSTRESLHDRYLRALGCAADVLVRARRHEQAVDCLQRGLEADPLAEDTYRRLMRAQLAREHRSEALATYRRCRTMLARHFDLEPSPDTEALRRRIEAG